MLWWSASNDWNNTTNVHAQLYDCNGQLVQLEYLLAVEDAPAIVRKRLCWDPAWADGAQAIGQVPRTLHGGLRGNTVHPYTFHTFQAPDLERPACFDV